MLVDVFTGFFDESNTHADAKWLVVGGFGGRAPDWLDFEERWAVLLNAHGLDHLHTKALMRLRQQFDEWTLGQRDRFVAKLAQSLRGAALVGWACAIDQSAFRAASAALSRKIPRDSAYGFCFRASALRILDHLAATGPEPVSFVLEQGHKNSGSALRIFEALRESSPQRGWTLGTMTFAGKQDYGALQAADFLTHIISKNVDALRAGNGHTKALSQLNFFSGALIKVDVYDEKDVEHLRSEQESWLDEWREKAAGRKTNSPI